MEGMELERKPVFYSLMDETGECSAVPAGDSVLQHLGGRTVLESVAVDAVFAPERTDNQPTQTRTGHRTTKKVGKTEDGRGHTASDPYSDYTPEQ